MKRRRHFRMLRRLAAAYPVTLMGVFRIACRKYPGDSARVRAEAKRTGLPVWQVLRRLVHRELGRTE